ncbi:trypsin-like peptidase domain-containing protein [Candidatus Gottesmanbacteria bacterium]|nr:trypsin-like peptidase domain-containing protein [Candidatus Gottesmanbacteria bacterium]
MKFQKIFLVIAAVVLVVGGVVSAGAFGLNWGFLNRYIRFQFPSQNLPSLGEKVKVVSEESLVIDVVKKASPSVVTVGISKTARSQDLFQIDPFSPFSPFTPRQSAPRKIEQDIGSGFIVTSDGLIVTNKHVVSDAQATYRVFTQDGKTYDVEKIYRDPANDVAIVKISATGLKPIDMGDSSTIQVGQMAIAIGTALGEFRNTVTVGVVSGVGRGISAGSPFEGYVEKLDNVIQTDAAINPGNSGGPLLNSNGQVVGVNTALAQEGQNIGFAIPVNVIKDALTNFNATGQFNRPFLGVEYRMVTRQIAVFNDVPEGAYVISVVDGSPAAKAGIKADDIIAKMNGEKVTESNDLAKIISKKKIGDTLAISLDRDGKEVNVTVTLGTQ